MTSIYCSSNNNNNNNNMQFVNVLQTAFLDVENNVPSVVCSSLGVSTATSLAAVRLYLFCPRWITNRTSSLGNRPKCSTRSLTPAQTDYFLYIHELQLGHFKAQKAQQLQKQKQPIVSYLKRSL
eukprot:TRINITY_DN2821_c3_g1_i3.p9 TRINITY_DN2821_c3_g1~~TRINITY_DN2821_c3_g1_i3.p9  ORF type:complete len:124 (-),score=2.54 TRINITY_DN2821_c3_g1_i3:2285-2656(-)